MGTDVINTAQTMLSAPSAAARFDLELSRAENFLNGSADLFDLLHPLEKKKKNLSGNVIDLLKVAYTRIQQTERTIAAQTTRIKELESILTTDELTKLGNRRGFFEAFKRELDRTNRGQSQGGLLVMIDLDNFKSINDHYGHLAGDCALRLVAEFLKSEIRDMDVAARLGGDEFIMIFPNASREKAMKRAQMLGMRLNNLSLVWENAEIRIGASIGLKEYKQGDTIDGIIHQADQNMYTNKKTKKDKHAPNV